MAKELILEGFRSYQQKVIPRDAGMAQIVETKRAFFAGAHYLLERIAPLMSEGDEPAEADLQLLRDVKAEITRFVEDQTKLARG